ncbi:MAG: TRAP transporter small permease [Chloroflexota bacterium]|nr:MAG: TRAP transporter small permease [Chloroflexota bacterium]
MFTKASEYMKKLISYPSSVMFGAAMVAMIFVMLAVSADVFMRYAFDSPIVGVWDLCTMAFAIIIWGPMAYAALKGSHIALTFLLDRFPRLPRLVLQVIISLVTSAMLGLVSWRLLLHAIHLDDTEFVSPTLRIPHAPITYFAAFACLVMALAFLTRLPEALGKFRKEQ